MDRFKSDHEIESGMPATPGDFCLDGSKQGVAGTSQYSIWIISLVLGFGEKNTLLLQWTMAEDWFHFTLSSGLIIGNIFHPSIVVP